MLFGGLFMGRQPTTANAAGPNTPSAWTGSQNTCGGQLQPVALTVPAVPSCGVVVPTQLTQACGCALGAASLTNNLGSFRGSPDPASQMSVHIALNGGASPASVTVNLAGGASPASVTVTIGSANQPAASTVKTTTSQAGSSSVTNSSTDSSTSSQVSSSSVTNSSTD